MKPENPYKNNPFQIDAWQEGYDARCAWEQEPCTEHEQSYPLGHPIFKSGEGASTTTPMYYPEHHYQCPVCMEVK